MILIFLIFEIGSHLQQKGALQKKIGGRRRGELKAPRFFLESFRTSSKNPLLGPAVSVGCFRVVRTTVRIHTVHLTYFSTVAS